MSKEPSSWWTPADWTGFAHKAAGARYARDLKKALAAGANPNWVPEGGSPALVLACVQSWDWGLEALLLAGADAATPSKDPRFKGWRALEASAFASFDAGVERLLGEGPADNPEGPGALFICSKETTPEDAEMRLRIVKRLLAAGADPNRREEGSSPFLASALGRDPELFSALLEGGGDPRSLWVGGGAVDSGLSVAALAAITADELHDGSIEVLKRAVAASPEGEQLDRAGRSPLETALRFKPSMPDEAFDLFLGWADFERKDSFGGSIVSSLSKAAAGPDHDGQARRRLERVLKLLQTRVESFVDALPAKKGEPLSL